MDNLFQQAIPICFPNFTNAELKSLVFVCPNLIGPITKELVLRKFGKTYEWEKPEGMLNEEWYSLLLLTPYQFLKKVDLFRGFKIVADKKYKEELFSVAVKFGRLGTIKKIISEWGLAFSDQQFLFVLEHGNLEITKWAFKHKDKIPPGVTCKYSSLDKLKWLHRNKSFQPDLSVFETAIQRDKLDIVKWLNKKFGYEPDQSLANLAVSWNLNCFKWIVENFRSCLDRSVIISVAEYGTLTIFKQIYKQKKFKFDEAMANYACLNKRDGLGIAKWIAKKSKIYPDGVIYPNGGIQWVCGNGDKEFLEWIFKSCGRLPKLHHVSYSLDRGYETVANWMFKELKIGMTEEMIFSEGLTDIWSDYLALFRWWDLNMEGGFKPSQKLIDLATKNGDNLVQIKL